MIIAHYYIASHWRGDSWGLRRRWSCRKALASTEGKKELGTFITPLLRWYIFSLIYWWYSILCSPPHTAKKERKRMKKVRKRSTVSFMESIQWRLLIGEVLSKAALQVFGEMKKARTCGGTWHLEENWRSTQGIWSESWKRSNWSNSVVEFHASIEVFWMKVLFEFDEVLIIRKSNIKSVDDRWFNWKVSQI